MITYPLMAFELLTGFAILINATQSKSYIPMVICLVLLVCIVLYTFAYLNPHFKKINGPADEVNLQKFLKFHWVRTFGYTARFLLIVLILLGSAE